MNTDLHECNKCLCFREQLFYRIIAAHVEDFYQTLPTLFESLFQSLTFIHSSNMYKTLTKNYALGRPFEGYCSEYPPVTKIRYVLRDLLPSGVPLIVKTFPLL